MTARSLKARLLAGWSRRLIIILHDLAITATALALAFVLRFDANVLEGYLPSLPLAITATTALAGSIYWWSGLYEAKWRFASVPDILVILKAVAAVTVVLLAADYMLRSPYALGEPYFGISLILIFALLQVGFLAGPRLAYRAYKDKRQAVRRAQDGAERAIILGNGRDADALLRAVDSGLVPNLLATAILSPRLADLGQRIRGVRVIERPGGLDDVLRVMKGEGHLPAIVIFCASILEDAEETSRLYTIARAFGLRALRLRADLDGIEVESGALTPFRIEDLLLRPTVEPDRERIERIVRGKCFAVTGGGGSIGAELTRRLALYGARDIAILDNSEPSLYAIVEELRRRFPKTQVTPVICDVRDRARVHRVLAELRPDAVFHAAALKHVDLLEANWSEGIKTNVQGTANVVDAAVEVGVEALVLISTDKAVEPVSILGATKRVAELLVHARDRALARDGKRRTRLVSVRFGNVLASTGSVVPKFLRQIEEGGPVTVTHKDVVRFFMTIPEACDLVLTAASHAVADAERRASLYILNMGQPIRIHDLAEKLIRFHGKEPGRDIAIEITGLRPGERLTEQVLDHGEPTVDVGLSGIICAAPIPIEEARLAARLATLAGAAEGGERERADAVFYELFPSYGGRP